MISIPSRILAIGQVFLLVVAQRPNLADRQGSARDRNHHPSPGVPNGATNSVFALYHDAQREISYQRGFQNHLRLLQVFFLDFEHFLEYLAPGLSLGSYVRYESYCNVVYDNIETEACWEPIVQSTRSYLISYSWLLMEFLDKDRYCDLQQHVSQHDNWWWRVKKQKKFQICVQRRFLPSILSPPKMSQLTDSAMFRRLADQLDHPGGLILSQSIQALELESRTSIFNYVAISGSPRSFHKHIPCQSYLNHEYSTDQQAYGFEKTWEGNALSVQFGPGGTKPGQRLGMGQGQKSLFKSIKWSSISWLKVRTN